jgi:O-antigen/teichoic acid export membrane protein
MSERAHRAELGRNTVWLLGARIGTQGALVLFSIVVARRLGTAGFGEYAFVASVLFVANVVTSFGTDMLLVREVAARRGTAMAPAALAVQLVLSVTILALVGIAAPLIPGQSPAAVAALRVGLITLLPLAPYTVLSAMLRGGARMRTYALLNLVVAWAQLLAALVVVPRGGTVLEVAVVLVATQTFAAVAAALACRLGGVDLRVLRADPRPHLGSLVRASTPIAILGALGMLYQRAAILLMSTLAGPAATGAFSAGLRTVEAAKTAHLAAWGALYPAFAEDHASEVPSSREATTRSLPALVLLAAVAAAGLTALADPLVPILFGAGFGPAIDAVRILAWVLIPYTIASHRSLVLVAARRESEVAWALALAVVTLVVGSALAIPSNGITGACWAVLVAECVQAAVLSAPWRAVGLAQGTRPAGYPR